MEKRKLYGMIIGIIAFIALVIGATVAYFSWSSASDNTNVNLTVSKGLENMIVYKQGTSILETEGQTLEASTDYTGGISATIEFWKKASVTKTIYGQISMEILKMLSKTDATDTNISKTDTVKWSITTYNVNNNNEVLLASGTFNGKSVGDKFPLTQDFELNNYQTFYKVYLWIDSSSINWDLPVSGELLSTEISASASDTISNYGPNPPKLTDGLIPVYYDESTNAWVKADSSNSGNNWYNYEAKKWANAVLVTSTNRSTYTSASKGTTINDNDILAFYVWIPRYKYKVWNITKTIGTDSYNAQTTGIDIVFESGTTSTGTISCNYDFTVTDGSLSETCTGLNGDYYTHPAFTFGNEEVTGFWIGKFEISSSNPSAEYGGGNTTSLEVRIIPNVVSWRNNSVSSFYTVIKNMQASSNVYGLSTDTSKVDSHMLKNMEWGALSYLTNSKYGRCTDGTCSEIYINNSSSYITGRSGGNVGGSTKQVQEQYPDSGSTSTDNYYDYGYYTYDGKTVNYDGTIGEYVADKTLGTNASTTGNIYGVYDMSGGSRECVMGNVSSTSGSYTYNAKDAGSNYSYTSETTKYIDEYALGETDNDQAAYNRARLGDATGEIVLSTGGKGGWYGDYAYFPYSSTMMSKPWFDRGGPYSASNGYSGEFHFNNNGGVLLLTGSTRSALLVR